MKPFEFDPIEFLGKIGIYREGIRFFKVQVVGVRQPDTELLFLTLQPVGDLSFERTGRRGVGNFTFSAEYSTEFTFGGRSGFMGFDADSVWVTYIGELVFSSDVITKFENQENNFWEAF